MTSQGKRNIPPKSYAIKRDKPKLRKQVQQTLTNKYGQPFPKEDATTIDTYYIMSKDSYYQGSWMGGLPHGPGIAIYRDGSYYMGNFDCGQAQDKNGYLILSNGAQFTGNVQKSKIHGYGVLKHKDYTYKGQWVNGRPHGEGLETFENGSSYKGYFQNGLKHCFEERSIKQKKQVKPKRLSNYVHEGNVYVGQFRQGLMHGYGELTNQAQHFSYVGEFKYGKKEGYGSLITSQGILTGDFKNDVINGPGTFEWRKGTNKDIEKDKDGRWYAGNFVNSKFEGEGTIIFPQGNRLTGLWKQGQSQSLKAVFGNNKMYSGGVEQSNNPTDSLVKQLFTFKQRW